jgi:hypothetical protein
MHASPCNFIFWTLENKYVVKQYSILIVHDIFPKWQNTFQHDIDVFLKMIWKLKSSLRKFYGLHHGLVNRYGLSVSQITTDMFHLKTLPSTFLIHDLSRGF